MSEDASIDKMLQDLQMKHNVWSTKDFRKDIKELVTGDVEKFIEVFTKDFSRWDFDSLKKFEPLKLNKKQKAKLNKKILRRYEYRNFSNLRCIFVVVKENNKSMCVLLCAFNENGGKKNGKDAYNKNIERAINICERTICE